jgi:hypothetical protein
VDGEAAHTRVSGGGGKAIFVLNERLWLVWLPCVHEALVRTPSGVVVGAPAPVHINKGYCVCFEATPGRRVAGTGHVVNNKGTYWLTFTLTFEGENICLNSPDAPSIWIARTVPAGPGDC